MITGLFKYKDMKGSEKGSEKGFLGYVVIVVVGLVFCKLVVGGTLWQVRGKTGFDEGQEGGEGEKKGESGTGTEMVGATGMD